uniref:Uncharacterized protein n=1 Tax=Anguilla anguilla TaxID=7936 RepID=A0A0E9T4Z1_ANGAN
MLRPSDKMSAGRQRGQTNTNLQFKELTLASTTLLQYVSTGKQACTKKANY